MILLFDAGRKHQGLAAAPRASIASPPNSPWFLAKARYKEWVCCLHFARVLLAPSFYKHNILKFGGWTHAHGMAWILSCGFIAQQCLVLASFSLTVLFIAKARPWEAGEVMTLSPHGPEGLQTSAWLKVMNIPRLATSLSLAHQWCLSPPQHHMATVHPLIRG
jgi:hypothetical protein